MALAQEKNRQRCPASETTPTVIKDLLKDSELSQSTYRKVGNKILDLQLPAEEYIDSEGDSSESEKSTAFTLNGTSQVVCNGLADLNVPFNLKEETGAESDDLQPRIHHGSSLVCDISRARKSGWHNFPNDAIQNLNKRKYLEDSSDDPMPKPGKKLVPMSSSNIAGQNGRVLNSQAGFSDTDRQSVPVESLSQKLEQVNIFACLQNYLLRNGFCFSAKSFNQLSIDTDDLSSCNNHGSSSASHELRECVQVSEDVFNPKNINLNTMPGYSDTITAFQSIHNSREEDKFECSRFPWLKEKPAPQGKLNEEGKSSTHVRAGEKFLENEKTMHECLIRVIDLNSCTNEDENTPMDIDLQAPTSPENKESSPPRGESDEAQEEQARMAAEALVSIFEVAVHNGLQMTTCSPLESSMSSPLHWFSGIVSAIVDHSESEVNLEQHLPTDFDYFEFMTLNLTETTVLDCFYKSNGQSKQGGEGSTSLTRSNRPRRGKDFQNETLPSLACLSRHEVTKDLKTIGSLVKAATARTTRSTDGCARSAGKNAPAKARRRPCKSASNITDLLKRGLISWQKICRKKRSQRFPVSNLQLIFKSST
ncbi:uncharacterized protein LOC107623029 isoform X2 [Arachis ipaensis]|uniref:uncharacterized protein LOC107623029 isoform X2 n=1 Tax=Arachis ipaensis TaxID=130454 RepID=UPI0007AF1F4C|nr:uncharacterized protein LOC107623029 isoform X2 [Arachis ipaensis]XP_029152204.1 uncharacterized protein LOC112783412 isoform X2 [Arachis hypogaea]QHN80250.1 uncharacterized protein DS421_20g676740 [Arachis hypogaea]QHN80251.1 uncharacterized protein DS421_20g676740 [Arachis hypogaea]